MPEEADARLQLAATQQVLYDALLEKPGGLAELYRAAIAILNDATLPDRLAVAAHELRELLEKLPGEEVDLGAGLNDRVKELEPLWKNASEEERTSGRDPWTGEVTRMLRRFLVAAQQFFEERTRIASTRADLLVRYLHKEDPAQVKLPKEVQQKNARRLMDLRRFFTGVAHHRFPAAEDVFQERVGQLEGFLSAQLNRRPTEDFAAIDALLREE
jgi:hypothetical protein